MFPTARDALAHHIVDTVQFNALLPPSGGVGHLVCDPVRGGFADQEAQVLHGQRIIEAHLLSNTLNILIGCSLPQDGHSRITRDQMHKGEDKDGDAK